MTEPSLAAPCLFTIGHSVHEWPHFQHLLAQHEVQVVVDVRSSPYSKQVPHASREALQAALKKAGLRYIFMGAELGGRPAAAEGYDDAGYARYDWMARQPEFVAGIERLLIGVRLYRLAILCSEENPATCHRARLVGRVVQTHGVEVRHIRGDGRLEDDAAAGVQCAAETLPDLFGNPPPWRSTRPIRTLRPTEQED